MQQSDIVFHVDPEHYFTQMTQEMTGLSAQVHARIMMHLIRKRPQPEIGAHDAPDLGHPFGLKNDKENDGQTEDELTQRRNGDGHAGGSPNIHQIFGDVAQDLIQGHDENGAEDGSGDASQSADNDHGDKFDGQPQIKGFRCNADHVVGIKSARQIRHKRSLWQMKAVCIGKMGMPIPSAARSLSRMAIKARPITGAHQVDRYPCHTHKADKDDVIKGPVVAQIQSEQGALGNDDAFCAAGEALPLDKDIFNDELTCQGGNGR